ncbi:MAG: DUF3347 domain-containing protein [Bacteroidia bacterium]
MKYITGIIVLTIFIIQSTFAQNEQVPHLKDLVFNSDPLSELFTAYINVKNNLVNTDSEAVRHSSQNFLTAIDQLTVENLNPKQLGIWKKYKNKLDFSAKQIAVTPNIDQQKEYFMRLSKNLFKILKSFKTNKIAIYYQYCPLAFKGKGGYWISEDKTINNPYLGKQIPTCGITKQTIPAKQ